MTETGARRYAVILGILLLIAGIECRGEKPRWSYAGATGPVKWGNLEKEFSNCTLGQNQAPIDIPDASTRKGDFPSLLFNYKPVPLKIIDDGHTLQVNYARGSFVYIDGDQYELAEFHFHKPSEEKIDHKTHDMDVHLVHRGPGGKLAIVAVLLDAGKENPVIKSVWDHLPKARGSEESVDGVTINAVNLLPDNKGYYRFTGSLTTPPCSENVTWIVFKTPVQLSAGAIARFGKLYPMNARPVQPVNGRDIQATR